MNRASVAAPSPFSAASISEAKVDSKQAPLRDSTEEKASRFAHFGAAVDWINSLDQSLDQSRIKDHESHGRLSNRWNYRSTF